MQNINRVVLTGNLTRDPELKSVGQDLQVCNLRVANNARVKRGGEWVDKPNYFDVVAFGAQAANCAKYLSKGRPVAIDGRLDWREWEAQDGGHRQAVQIIADSVQFLDGGQREEGHEPAPVSSSPAREEEDIPFLWEGSVECADVKSHVSRW